MQIEAHLNRTWAIKWLIMGLVLVGFGVLCIRDGSVVYPQMQERHAIFTEYDEIGDMDGWYQRATDEGWPTDPPRNYSDMDIATQWVMLAIAWPLGFAALGMVLWFRGRKLTATDHELISHRGEHVPYDAITAIDKERWDSKGIAYVHWEHDGRSGRIKIDDFVFRDAWRVLDQVEDQTGLTENVPN